MTTVDDAQRLARWWSVVAGRVAPSEICHLRAVAQAGWWSSIADASQAIAAAELQAEIEVLLQMGGGPA